MLLLQLLLLPQTLGYWKTDNGILSLNFLAKLETETEHMIDISWF